MGKEYQGTLSVTVNGITCQEWGSQAPHVHSMDITKFIEDDYADVANFCR